MSRSPEPLPTMDADERAFRSSFARMVEWYRVEQTRALWRAFWPGAFVFLPLGCLLVALAMADRVVPFRLQPLFTVVGVLVTASGPLWAIAHLLLSIRSDLYVAIRVDGLAVRLNPHEHERVYAWEGIEDARYDEQLAALVVSLGTGERLAIAERFAELSADELGGRIRDARRLAVWNRLKPRFDCESLE